MVTNDVAVRDRVMRVAPTLLCSAMCDDIGDSTTPYSVWLLYIAPREEESVVASIPPC